MPLPALHAYPLVRPRDLDGQPNGRLPANLLAPTAGGDVMHHLAARAFNAMYAHAKRMGVTLTMTDGYRDYDTQVRLFTSRYQLSYNPITCTTQSKVWGGRRWWKRRGVATAAAPGSSNHGWGLATDIATVDGSDGDDDLRWLGEFAADYGFSWELLPEEPWHIRYVQAERIPGAVLDYEAPQGNPQPQPQQQEDDMLAILTAPGRPWFLVVNGVEKRELKHGDEVPLWRALGAHTSPDGSPIVTAPEIIDAIPSA